MPSSHLLLLNEIARIIGGARSLDDVLGGVVGLVAERMNTDVCSIWLLDGPRTKLVLRATAGLAEDAVGRATLQKGEGLTWQTLERDAPVLLEDAHTDPHYRYLPETEEEPFHSFLALPLRVRGMPIGALSVQTRDPRSYTPDEVRALSAIASQIAPVVDNARLLALVEEDGGVAAPRETGERRAVGTPCSSGVVAGSLLVLGRRVPVRPAARGDTAAELEQLGTALEAARGELVRMQDWLRERQAEEAALVFTVQLMLLEDPAFEGRIRQAVEEGALAFDAVARVGEKFIARFAELEDMFFQERAADVHDLAGRLQRLLSAEDGGGAAATLEGRVAVLPDLTPSRLVSLSAGGVAAVLCGGGGATSHAALLARSLDLPLVVGLGDFVKGVRDDQRVLVDASSGEVVVDPPESLVRESLRTRSAWVETLQEFTKDASPDTAPLALDANVSLWGDATRARDAGADGIGLYRTEFAFLMRPDLPGEDEQYVLYRRVVEEVAPKPVTFRLLDAGGDKLVPALGQSTEPNPFLGYRSLRLLLDHPEILTAQARSIYHALEGTDGHLLVPMVGDVEEFRAVRTTLERAGLRFASLGAMVEMPSLLMQLDEVADEASFLCVGTNDLVQHLLGVDRTNARVTRYFDACHPSVIRAIVRIARAAKKHGVPLRICGEAASDPLLLPLWIGLGAQRLSVHAKRIPVLRALAARYGAEDQRELVQELLHMERAADVRKRLEACAASEVLTYLALVARGAS